VYNLPRRTGGAAAGTGSGLDVPAGHQSLLGLTLRVDENGASLAIVPCVPAHWTSYAVDYRFRETTYRIEIRLLDDLAEGPAIELDGQACLGNAVALVDDRLPHAVRVRVARSSATPGSVEGAIG
jgi:cellobiose phosphorylase